MLFVGECFLEKLGGSGTHELFSNDTRDGVVFDVSYQLVLVASLPRRRTKQHFVEDDANGPYIALRCVGCPFQQLRSHVNGTPHARFQHLRAEVIHVLGEPEVADLINTLVDEYVGWF